MLQLFTPLAVELTLNPRAQAIVIADTTLTLESLRSKWIQRAACVVYDRSDILYDVIRELLNNPQIRALVFDGACACREMFRRFWTGEEPMPGKIDDEHLTLVRRFVDLYDDDFGHRVPQPPFWPTRVKYLT